MGKRSRAKKEIRAIRAGVQGLYEPKNPSWQAEAAVRQAARDVEFQARVVAVAKLFQSYDPTDVVISLGVSDLFLPNVASPVKHAFAMRVFTSMAEDQFGSDRITCNAASRLSEGGRGRGILTPGVRLDRRKKGAVQPDKEVGKQPHSRIAKRIQTLGSLMTPKSGVIRGALRVHKTRLLEHGKKSMLLTSQP